MEFCDVWLQQLAVTKNRHPESHTPVKSPMKSFQFPGRIRARHLEIVSQVLCRALIGAGKSELFRAARKCAVARLGAFPVMLRHLAVCVRNGSESLVGGAVQTSFSFSLKSLSHIPCSPAFVFMIRLV